jgi:hypothetical protein
MIRKKRRGCAIVPARGRDLNLVIAPSLGTSNRLFRSANRRLGAAGSMRLRRAAKYPIYRDRTFCAHAVPIRKGAPMTQADHYRDQSIRAKRLARAVADPEASRKLAEMAEEFRLYAERLEDSSRWKSAAAS